MKLYVYNTETLQVAATAEGESNADCEEKAMAYTNDYGFTYTPAFGAADGLIENPEAEIL